MTGKERSGSGKPRGFAIMDNERKRQIASVGGRASAKTRKTSNRGFASMDKDRQREISSKGGKASLTSRRERSQRDEADTVGKDIKSEKGAEDKDLNSLEGEDELESSMKSQESLSYSETDEDEDEGLGDGNLGRSTSGTVWDE